MKKTLLINGRRQEIPDLSDEDAEQIPLLWALRDHLGLTGTKFGCGIGICGACTVLVDGRPTRSCVTRLSDVQDKPIATIEDSESELLRTLQDAWIAEQVPQCGYCQSGMLMAASALLDGNADPSDVEIDAAMTNLCRCGTYPRIRRAIQRAARLRAASEPGESPR